MNVPVWVAPKEAKARLKDFYDFTLIEKSLKEKDQNDFELKVYKLAYEWKCNGVAGTYEEVLEQARKTVEGWEQINKRGYGEVLL